MDLGVSGLASGFDWRSMVDQLVEVERSPQLQLRAEQNRLRSRNSALAEIKTQLETLRTRADTLRSADLFNSRTVGTSDTSLATGTAGAGAPLGTYRFHVNQLATASLLQGATNIGQPLSLTDDVSGVSLGSANFPTAVTAGTFTVNGKRITIDTTDSLQDVLDRVTSATGITASYSAATDRITLTGASEIILGSATDSSNFLQAARLTNNGTASISSSSSLGSVRSFSPLASGSLATPISDGGSGQGEFLVNGTRITFNAATDSLNDVLARINTSEANVVATYDSQNDRLVLTNRTTGDLGVALEDVSGNFLAATGLTTGSLSRGKNLTYTLNDGPTLTSQSNTITDASSGLAGLNVTVANAGAFTVTVATDTSRIKSAISDFLSAYNGVQSLINTQVASTTDAQGKVSAGILADDRTATELNSQLRQQMTADVAGLTSTLKRLDDLGFASNGNDDSLATSNTADLEAALADHLDEVRALFTQGTTGVAQRVHGYLNTLLDDDGAFVSHQNELTRQASDIDVQVADMERLVQSNRERLIENFVAMEKAQARINQQLQFLLQRFQ